MESMCEVNMDVKYIPGFKDCGIKYADTDSVKENKKQNTFEHPKYYLIDIEDDLLIEMGTLKECIKRRNECIEDKLVQPDLLVIARLYKGRM